MKPLKLTRTPFRLPCALVLGVVSCTSTPESNPGSTSAEPPAEETEMTTESQVPDAPKAEVETLEFEIEIAAPVEQVWDTMLSPEGYTRWTAPFMAGSYFEGSWSEGERMHFLAPGGSGMVAEIAVSRPHEIVSIRHIGFVMGGVEDTTSPGVRSWAPAYETYRFTAVPGGTRVSVEQDVLAGMEAYMSGTWPRALAALQALCEAE